MSGLLNTTFSQGITIVFNPKAKRGKGLKTKISITFLIELAVWYRKIMGFGVWQAWLLDSVLLLTVYLCKLLKFLRLSFFHLQLGQSSVLWRFILRSLEQCLAFCRHLVSIICTKQALMYGCSIYSCLQWEMFKIVYTQIKCKLYISWSFFLKYINRAAISGPFVEMSWCNEGSLLHNPWGVTYWQHPLQLFPDDLSR